VYPEGFLLETQATIDLLFPGREPKQVKRRLRLSEKKSADLEVGHVGSRKAEADRCLNEYKYWGRRLSDIDDAYEALKRGSMRQW
jgi:hypothetical protein